MQLRNWSLRHPAGQPAIPHEPEELMDIIAESKIEGTINAEGKLNAAITWAIDVDEILRTAPKQRPVYAKHLDMLIEQHYISRDDAEFFNMYGDSVVSLMDTVHLKHRQICELLQQTINILQEELQAVTMGLPLIHDICHTAGDRLPKLQSEGDAWAQLFLCIKNFHQRFSIAQPEKEKGKYKVFSSSKETSLPIAASITEKSQQTLPSRIGAKLKKRFSRKKSKTESMMIPSEKNTAEPTTGKREERNSTCEGGNTTSNKVVIPVMVSSVYMGNQETGRSGNHRRKHNDSRRECHPPYYTDSASSALTIENVYLANSLHSSLTGPNNSKTARMWNWVNKSEESVVKDGIVEADHDVTMDYHSSGAASSVAPVRTINNSLSKLRSLVLKDKDKCHPAFYSDDTANRRRSVDRESPKAKSVNMSVQHRHIGHLHRISLEK